MKRLCWLAVAAWLCWMVLLSSRSGQIDAAPNAPEKSLAGKAYDLRAVPKHFATLLRVEAEKGQVRLAIEGQVAPSTWNVLADAEIKVRGFWGRLEDLLPGDRVWVWFDADQQKQPRSVLMLADEISEQDIHNLPVVLVSADAANQTVAVKPSRGPERTLQLAAPLRIDRGDGHWLVSDGQRVPFRVQTGANIYVQSAGKTARLMFDEAALEQARAAQQDRLRQRWQQHGLPGTLAVLAPSGDELDVVLDHETIRWGRFLQAGDQVTLAAQPPIQATVRHVTPERERTQLRLTTAGGLDKSGLVAGQRVRVLVTEPPAEVQNSPLPPDLDRPRSRQERIDWFMSTIYCTCGGRGDDCTGEFYVLNSCNAHACGWPKMTRAEITAQVDKGLNDRQILDALLKSRGSLVLKPHLRP